MKKKLAIIFVLLITATALCAVASFFASAAETPEYDFLLTAPDGTETYLNVSDLKYNDAKSPTYKATQNGGKATLKLLREVKTTDSVVIHGNVDVDGSGYKYTYAGRDYAFWCVDSPSTSGYGIYINENEMKTVKFQNLYLRGVCEVPHPEQGKKYVAGGFKFYNSIIDLGEGNNIETENFMVLTARSCGKLIISGGSYESSSGNAMFNVGGDHEQYAVRVSCLIKGGTLYSKEKSTPTLLFTGSAKEPNSCSCTITGGTFYTAGAVVCEIRRGNLSIEGGDFYGNITITSLVTANISGGNFPKGCVVTGSTYTADSKVKFEDPIVANVYVEGVLKYEMTRSEFVTAFNELTPVSDIMKSLRTQNYRVELLEDFSTYRIQLAMHVNTGKTAIIDGNGKTIKGHTTANPIFRAHGPGSFVMNDFNLYNEGASCFQFYSGVTVDINRCIWTTLTHRTIFPTNSGVINIREGSIMRGGGSVLYFNILGNHIAEINVYSGASLIGTGDEVITFQAGSHGARINIAEGANVRVKDKNGYVVYIPADRVTDSDGNPIDPEYVYDNQINVNGGILEGRIQNNSNLGKETNIINLNSGTIYTSQSRSDVQNQSVQHKINENFVFAEPPTDPYYVVSIPGVVSITPEKGYDFNISADIWRFDKNSQLTVSVESANGFVMTCPQNPKVFNYSIMSMQMGSLHNGCVAACFTGSTPNTVSLHAYMHDGQKVLYAGEYSDVLTFTLNYTNDAANLVSIPVSNVGNLTWHNGYVASGFYGTSANQWKTIDTGENDDFKYSDILLIPKAGTTVTFKDYYDPSINVTDVNYPKTATGLTTFGYCVFSVCEYKDDNWDILLDRVWKPGILWVDYYPGTPSNVDLNRRGYRINPETGGIFNKDNPSYCKYEIRTETIDGKEYTYAVWTYTTLRDNESLRLCYAYGFEKTMPSAPSPNVTVTPP